MELAMSDRLALWNENRDVAMFALAHLLDENEEDEIDEPMVLICDENDEFGRELTYVLTKVVDDYEDIAAIIIAGSNGVSIIIVPTEIVQDVTQKANPVCSKALDKRPPEDTMWAGIVAYGGITLLHVPIQPLRAIGSA